VKKRPSANRQVILVIFINLLRYLLITVPLLFVGFAVFDWYSAAPPEALAKATFVGRNSCAACHQEELARWTGSHHDRAMELATEETVLGDFNGETFDWYGEQTRYWRDGKKFMVTAEGPDGQPHDYEVKYTFGFTPLQQYMVEFPDGRVQVQRVSWNTEKKEWFYVTPPDVTAERIPAGDPLHWTGITQNWNSTCAECHSTNLKKNYDLAQNAYHTTFSEIDVSCEECHGPASLHLELASAKSLFWDRRHGYGLAKLKSLDSTPQIETCAKCHARRSEVHGDFRPGARFADHYDVALLDENLYHADGQQLDEVYNYGSFLQSKMHAKGVRCTDCHDPHSLKVKFTGNALCSQCHAPAKYDSPAHHHHLANTPAASCVECHMPTTNYMVIDARHDHSFKPPRPDLTVSTGAPNVCNRCHTKPEETAQETAQWAAQKVVEWYGPERKFGLNWAAAIAAGRKGAADGEKLLAEVVRSSETPAIVRATATELLAQYSSSSAHSAIGVALKSDSPVVRLAATRVANDAAQLTARLRDDNTAVRQEAARRLVGAPLSAADQSAFGAALGEYKARQQLALEHAGTHLNLASLARELGDSSTAIAELRTAIKLNDYLSGPRAELASLLEESGGEVNEIANLRREERARLERDAKLLPDNADIRYRLGLLEFLLKDLAAADASLAEACRLAPTNYQYHLGYALLLEKRYVDGGDEADRDRAIAALRKLESLNPSDPTAKEILKRMLSAKQEG